MEREDYEFDAQFDNALSEGHHVEDTNFMGALEAEQPLRTGEQTEQTDYES